MTGSARRVRDGLRIDRRTFLKVVGLSAAGALTANRAVAQGIVAPSATPAPPEPDPIASLALELEFDQERIFRFVSERIRYEPYAGVLRGAKGTLMARAGNSADQALLLAALLDAAAVPYRFARGPIDEAAAEALLGSALIDEDEARQEFVEAITGTGAGGRPLRAEDIGAQVSDLEAVAPPTDDVLAWASDRLLDMIATVEASLASAGISLPGSVAGLPAAEQHDHVWIQAAHGPMWLDLDPSVPNAQMGSAHASVASWDDTLPEELRHRLRFDVLAETISGGSLAETSILEVEDFADTLANLPIGVLNIERDGLKALGATILSGLEGGTTYVPCLIVGETVLIGSGAIRFGGAGDGPFDALAAEAPGLRDGEPTAQWLQVTIVSPGREERVLRRPIFDRLGPAARSGGAFDLGTLQPAELVQVRPEGPPDHMPARRTHWLTVHTGTLGGAALEEALRGPDKPSALANLARGFHLFREAAGIELALPIGVRTFIDGPDIVGVTVDQELVDGAEVESRLALDIWHRSLSPRPLPDVAASVDPAVLAGVLPHLVERLMAGEIAATAEGAERAIGSVGAVFEAAAREGIGTIVVRSPDQADALPFAPDALARLRASVAAGLVAIAPERPPSGAGGRVGWWLVDPASGRTVDEMDDGRGTVDQYAATVRVTVVETAGPMQDLGICVAIIFWTATATLLTIGAAVGTAAAASQGKGLAAALLGTSTVVGSGAVGGVVGADLGGASLVAC